MNSLYYIGSSEFQRILNHTFSSHGKTHILSTMARINALYMIARAGSGHIGSSFSSMDIFSSLYHEILEENDIFFSSKGHDAPGLYSVLIGLGRLPFDNIHMLRRLNGLPGHPDVGTPGMVTNTGSLGMGVSKAKGLARANRLDRKNGKIYVLTGDGELQEGQFWEALQGAVNEQFDEITVIVDHNKIQSDTWVETVSDLGDLEGKLSKCGWHVQRCNGHDFEEFNAAVEKAKVIKGIPQIIIADTIKGKGVSFMESTTMPEDEEFYTFHSGAPSPEHYSLAVNELVDKANKFLVKENLEPLSIEEVAIEITIPPESVQKLIPAYEKALLAFGKRREDIVVLDADLMIDCGLLSFRNAYPERFFECGIAEQDMVSQAGALALNGKLPVSHSFACFLATRANEQIANNASERTKCIYTGSLAGMLPAGPGHSHQMVRDISALGGIPGLTLIEPSCEEEVEMVLDYAVEINPSSTYIRMVSIPCQIPFTLPQDYKFQEGKGVALTEGDDAILFAYGPVMLSEAWKASDILKNEHKFGLKVVNLPWLNRIDKDWLRAIIGEKKHVITLDNHLMTGGQGQYIGSAITELGMSGSVHLKRLGLDDIPSCGQNDEVLVFHGLDSSGIMKSILENRLE